MKKLIYLVVMFPSLLWGQRLSTNLNQNWRFTTADVVGAAHPKCDVSSWKEIDLPYDYGMENPYSPSNTPNNGWLPISDCWFRKTITVTTVDFKKRFYLCFDGVYMNSEVYVNGEAVGIRPYGFISFNYDITNYLKEGNNVISVHIKNSKLPTSRFYHSSSIYGDVELMEVPSLHIPVSGGVFYRLISQKNNSAKLLLQTEVLYRSASRNPVTYKVEHKLFDREGNEIASVVNEPGKIRPEQQQLDSTYLTINDVHLWDVDDPYLYRLETSILSDDKLIDKNITKVGIRTTEFDSETGFHLNGKSMKLQGMCEHMEMLPAGLAIPEDMWRKRILALKSMGCNTIRTAHNPFPPIFYELCDELGMMVVDEIFDGWFRKGANDYASRFFAEWWRKDVKDWVRRDRNHPSVILWSVGNETGDTDVHHITEEIHKYDGYTRPTSGGNVLFGTDISGFTGMGAMPGGLEKFHKEYPNRSIVLLEVPHTIQTRGFYRVPTWWRDKGGAVNEYEPYGTKQIFFDGHPRYCSSYDNCAVRITARSSWKRTKDTPWIIGEFRWTGFESFGESQFMGAEFPKRSYNDGIIDLAGFRKDHYYFYQSQWTQEPMVHVLPHWTHPDLEEGTIIPVVAYSNCDQVELFLNGRSLGKKTVSDLLDFVWKVPYKPGKLKAVGYKNGVKCTETVHYTASNPTQLKLTLDDNFNPEADGKVSYLTVSAVDKKGHFVPWASNQIKFHIDGNTKVLGFENGNPIDGTHQKAMERTLFYGLARGFFQNTTNNSPVSVTAGAILGDTLFSQKTEVAIHVATAALRGQLTKRKYEIYYTTDGSTPTTSSVLYRKPFELTDDATIKAIVLFQGKKILSLEEKFSKGEQPHFVDSHLVTDELLKGKFTGPFDSEIVGRWIDKKTNTCYLFEKNGNFYKFIYDGYHPDLLGRWWYDYPDDKMENPDATGHGELKWSKGEQKVSLKLEKGNDNCIIIDNSLELVRDTK